MVQHTLPKNTPIKEGKTGNVPDGRGAGRIRRARRWRPDGGDRYIKHMARVY